MEHYQEWYHEYTREDGSAGVLYTDRVEIYHIDKDDGPICLSITEGSGRGSLSSMEHAVEWLVTNGFEPVDYDLLNAQIDAAIARGDL